MSCVTKTTVQPVCRPDLVEFGLQDLTGLGVERTERLVHQHERRLVREDARDLHALTHTARKLGRELVTGGRQATIARYSAAIRAWAALSAPCIRGPYATFWLTVIHSKRASELWKTMPACGLLP